MQTILKKPEAKTKNQIRKEKGQKQQGRKVGTTKANKAIKKAQYEKILNYMENDKTTRLTTLNKYRKIFTFLFYTGCRINEVCKLKTEDIQNILTHSKARILTDKTKRFKGQEFRTIHFSPLAVAAIKEDFKDILHNPDSYCIRAYNNKDKEINISRLTNNINKYLETIFGNKDYTTHSFRRGMITEMILDENVKPEIVQAYIGHKNYATTARYIKVEESDIQNALIR